MSLKVIVRPDAEADISVSSELEMATKPLTRRERILCWGFYRFLQLAIVYTGVLWWWRGEAGIFATILLIGCMLLAAWIGFARPLRKAGENL